MVHGKKLHQKIRARKKRKSIKGEVYRTPPDPLSKGEPGSPPRRQPANSSSSSRLNTAKGNWDAENVQIPKLDQKGKEKRVSKDTHVEDAISNFRNNIRDILGYEMRPFDAFKVDFGKGFLKTKLQALGLNIYEVESSGIVGRDDVDIELEAHLNLWMVFHQPPAPVVLIVSDKDYVRLINRLQDHGCTVSVVTGPTSAKELDCYNPYNWLDLVSSSPSVNIAPNSTIPVPLRTVSGEVRSLDSLGVMVFWDLLTCPLPSHIDPTLLRINIDQALKELGFHGVYRMEGFVLAGRNETLTSQNRKILRESGIDMTSLQPPVKGVFSHDRDFIDVRIRKQMCLWGVRREPPSPILLISDDNRFTRTISELCTKANFHIFLAHGPQASQELRRAGTGAFLWSDIAGGSTGMRDTGKKKKKKKNQRAEEGRNKRQKT